MNTRLFIILLVPAFFLAAPAFAQQSGPTPGPVTIPTDAPERSQVEFLLGSFHELPAKSKFEEVADVRALLGAMAADATAPRLQKRALEALGYWADDATLAVYESVLSDPQTRFGTRHFALLLTGKTFGAAGLSIVEPYLASKDVQLRLTAVDAVAATKSDRGFELLRMHAQNESNELVLERIEKMGSRLR